MSEHIKTVEINGIKFEVDLRQAKVINTFRVGDRVKVLIKSYGSTFNSCLGVIAAFDAFNMLPTVTVCYIDNGYSGELKFAAINAETKDIEIVATVDDVLVDKHEILRRMDRAIDTKQAELNDLLSKRKFFNDRFGAWFEHTPQDKPVLETLTSDPFNP